MQSSTSVVGSMVHALVLSAASALASPSPAPTSAAPAPQGVLTTAGVLRAYAFQKINQSGTNQRAINFGGSLHADYAPPNSPLAAGLTYFFADPLGANGPQPQRNPGIDNSLPGYAYSSLGELYLQYRTFRDLIQTGKMSIVTPWAGPADARLIPVTYQGTMVRRYFAPGWDAGIMRIARYKSRTSFTFDANDQLTPAATGGFLLLDLTRTAGSFTGSLHHYRFYDVADLTYAYARVDFSPRGFAAVQGIIENNAGRSLVGLVHNHTIGVQLGRKIGAATATLSYNYAPPVSYVTANPASVFVPTGGTPAVRSLGGGLFRVAGGGIASPYTDGLTADPLFTTSIVASFVERRSTGSGVKLQVSAASGNGRLSGSVAHAFYDYGNALGPATATESEADVTYQISNLDIARPGTGLSLRQRWAYRASSGPPFGFLYSRTQLQYSF